MTHWPARTAEAAIATLEATSDEDHAAFSGLIRECVERRRERYRQTPWLIDLAFSCQSPDRELAMLRSANGPPIGRTGLAAVDNEMRGCAALCGIGEGVCEMKRMFAPPGFTGEASVDAAEKA